jgi:hypothetical protein
MNSSLGATSTSPFRLEALPIETLQKIILDRGISISAHATKEQLVEKIIEIYYNEVEGEVSDQMASLGWK